MQESAILCNTDLGPEGARHGRKVRENPVEVDPRGCGGQHNDEASEGGRNSASGFR